MGLTLQTPPGFSDLADSVLVADSPAFAIDLAKIYSNAAFGMVRTECFHAIYKNGDQIPLPVSPTDGYAYDRTELLYIWTVRNSVDPATGWITGEDSLWYCNWLVDQTTGNVYSNEWYRRSGAHYDGVHTNDGSLEVFTIAQRQKSSIIMGIVAAYTAFTSTIAQDSPLTQLLAQTLNEDAKFSIVNSEIFYLGEYYNGQTVVMPTSPADGYAYSAGECHFMFSWRWTPAGNTGTMTQPPLSYGQMGPFVASVNSSGVVATIVEYIDNNGALNYTANGRLAVFALCQRSGTPGVISPVANAFTEIDYDYFMPGDALPAPIVQDIVNDIYEALLTPEYFGPTTYANGATIPTPVSPIDGYTYVRAELQYIWTWSDTTNQSGSDLRLPLFLGSIDDVTGVVTLATWRLPPGGPYVDDDNTKCRISVIVYARRQAQHAALTTANGTNPASGFTTTGGNVVADIPFLNGFQTDVFTGDGITTGFTLTKIPAFIVVVAWNGTTQLPSKYSFTGTAFTAAFTDPNGNPYVADTGDPIQVVYAF